MMGTYTKAIVAFVGLVLTNLFANYVQSGQAIPNTVGEWATAVLTTILATAAVYQLPNTGVTVVKR